MSREGWIRPAIMATEPIPRRVARRRRLVIWFVVIAILVVGLGFLARAFLGSGEGNPQVSGDHQLVLLSQRGQ